MEGKAPARSRLVSVGKVLAPASLVLSIMFAVARKGVAGVGVRFALAFVSDLFLVCFFAGLGCLIIGALRDRRWRRSASASGQQQ
jgi:hypothetical protein